MDEKKKVAASTCFPTPPFPPDCLPVATVNLSSTSWFPCSSHCFTTPPLTPCSTTKRPLGVDVRAKEEMDENKERLFHEKEQVCSSSSRGIKQTTKVNTQRLETPQLADNGDSNSSEDVDVNVLTDESPPKAKRKKKDASPPVSSLANLQSPATSTSHFTVDSLLQRPPLVDRLNVQQEQQLKQPAEGWSAWSLASPAFHLQPPEQQFNGLFRSSLLLAAALTTNPLLNPFLTVSPAGPSPVLGGNSSGESYSSAFSAYNTSSTSSSSAQSTSNSSGLEIPRRGKAHSSTTFPSTPVGRAKRRNSEEIIAPGHSDSTVEGSNATATPLKTVKQGHFECSQCTKVFKRLWLLTNHYRTHTGEKPFECEFCHRCFADKSNLRAHVQTHSEEKRFVCGNCGRRFAVKSYLSKHEESACGQQAHHSARAANNKRGRPATGHIDTKKSND